MAAYGECAGAAMRARVSHLACDGRKILVGCKANPVFVLGAGTGVTVADAHT